MSMFRLAAALALVLSAGPVLAAEAILGHELLNHQERRQWDLEVQNSRSQSEKLAVCQKWKDLIQKRADAQGVKVYYDDPPRPGRGGPPPGR